MGRTQWILLMVCLALLLFALANILLEGAGNVWLSQKWQLGQPFSMVPSPPELQRITPGAAVTTQNRACIGSVFYLLRVSKCSILVL